METLTEQIRNDIKVTQYIERKLSDIIFSLKLWYDIPESMTKRLIRESLGDS